MTNHAIALSALFLVFSTPGISSSTNLFQTLFDDAKEDIEISFNDTTSAIQNLTDITLATLNSGIVKMKNLRDTLAEYRENASNATCLTSLDKLDTAINTTIVHATEKYESLIESVNSDLEGFGFNVGSIRNDMENFNSELSSCGERDIFTIFPCIYKSPGMQSLLKLIPTDIANLKTNARALIKNSESRIAAFEKRVTENVDNVSSIYFKAVIKCGIAIDLDS